MNITAFAQYAGVSKAAVSRYFNGGYLSAEKRAQIAAAVEATGYRPSMQAQMLRTRRTRQIGVIMPRLSSESCARMVEGISRVLDDQNYQLLLINTANDNTREVRALDTLRHDTVDGIILIATMFTPEHHAVLQSLHVPVVIVGQQYPGFSCVFHDDFGAAQAATAHMLQKGRRKPGYLGVTLLDKAVGLARREGFDSALRDAGLVPQPQRMSIAKFNMESGYHQAEQLFGRAPGLDCLFCATDSIALGALQYCRSHSLRVPEDIMIAAVGDNRIGRVAYVPLTSAHLHYRTAGDKAARLTDLGADEHFIALFDQSLGGCANVLAHQDAYLRGQRHRNRFACSSCFVMRRMRAKRRTFQLVQHGIKSPILLELPPPRPCRRTGTGTAAA